MFIFAVNIGAGAAPSSSSSSSSTTTTSSCCPPIPIVMISKQNCEDLQRVFPIPSASVGISASAGASSAACCDAESHPSSSNTSSSAGAGASASVSSRCLCATLSFGAAVLECCICAESMISGEEVIKLPCGHVYHSACVLRWLDKHTTCPMCRSQLPAQQQMKSQQQHQQAGLGSEF